MKGEYLYTIDRFSSKKVLVIGDFILDVYLKGTSSRLSPEAPVPVVDIAEKIELTGGAANTACNLRALGAQVSFLSVIGSDEDGDRALQSLGKAAINIGKVIRSDGRKTIVKTRVMSGPHVLTRYDYGTESSIEAQIEQKLIAYLQEEYMYYDAVIISDYNKGVITKKLVEALLYLRQWSPKFLAVDSKRLPYFKVLKPSLVKPNYDEAIRLLDISCQYTARAENVQSLGDPLYESTHADIIAVTLDKDGAVVFQRNKVAVLSRAHPVSVPNVAGAGDTFISTFTLACICGVGIEGAAELSAIASAIAVNKECTASCSNRELKGYFSVMQKFVVSIPELEQLSLLYKSQGKRIVFTNGCFDILHSGHVSYLKRARELGDVLIVGINRDESIRRIKGAGRPINPLQDRMQVLSGLMSVDHVIAFGDERDDTPVALIRAAKPDVFVKGGDYTIDRLPEAATVEEAGGEIVFLQLVPDHSTTRIIKQIHKASSIALT